MFLTPILVFIVVGVSVSRTQESTKFSSFDLLIPRNGTNSVQEPQGNAVGNGTTKTPRMDLISLLNVYDVSAIRSAWYKESGRISDSCRRDTDTFLTALEDSQLWALKGEFFLRSPCAGQTLEGYAGV